MKEHQLITEIWRRFLKEARDKDRGKNFDIGEGAPIRTLSVMCKVSSMEDPLMRKNREKHPDADRVPSDPWPTPGLGLVATIRCQRSRRNTEKC